MIKVHANWISWFGFDGLTIGKLVFLNDKAYNDERLLKHEQVHINQYQKFGVIKFLVKYVYFHFKYGYQNNPFEVEARRAEC